MVTSLCQCLKKVFSGTINLMCSYALIHKTIRVMLFLTPGVILLFLLVDHYASHVVFPPCSRPGRCIPCKGSRYPPTLPRPAVAILPFKLPLCQTSTEKGQMEVNTADTPETARFDQTAQMLTSANI